MSEVTVGIDIGTTSVKAVAADADGEVVARARVPHELRVPAPGRLEHAAAAAWRAGPRAALDALAVDGSDVRGVSVAAMVPSLTAVDDTGTPVAPGLLYGDERGRTTSVGSPAESGELVAFLRWLLEAAPGAHGYWPAQAVANHALAGAAVLDTATAATAAGLLDWSTG
ncbi:MAG TPA: FGGY family carbohydrate kinase, partial [Acidimicrobiia bacterium]